MAYQSRVFYASTSEGTTEYNFSFSRISDSYIKVYINGTAMPATVDGVSITYTVGTSSITLSAGVLNKTLEIRRETPKTPLVNFVSGATLTETDLDVATQQSLDVSVESSDDAYTSVQLDSTGSYIDAETKKISNVVDGTSAQDAVTKSQLDTLTARVATEEGNVDTLQATALVLDSGHYTAADKKLNDLADGTASGDAINYSQLLNLGVFRANTWV